MINGSYDKFVKDVLSLTDIDLANYKEQQMKRRLSSLIESYGINNFRDYFQLIATDQKARRRFLDKTTINVSEFFRNPEKFDELIKVHLPKLLKKKNTLKVWSAGCSIGVEAYTLAMLFRENKNVLSHKILATDIDNSILALAREGFYSDHEMKFLPAKYKKKYFTPDGNFFKISSELKRTISFRHHNLLADSFESGFDLILCRNVVIYFTDETKLQLYTRFTKALRPGGILFIGSTERIFKYREIGLELLSPFFYIKEAS